MAGRALVAEAGRARAAARVEVGPEAAAPVAVETTVEERVVTIAVRVEDAMTGPEVDVEMAAQAGRIVRADLAMVAEAETDVEMVEADGGAMIAAGGLAAARVAGAGVTASIPSGVRTKGHRLRLRNEPPRSTLDGVPRV